MRGGFELDNDGRLPGSALRVVRDFMLGIGLFVGLMAVVHWGADWWAPSKAVATEFLSRRAGDLTTAVNPGPAHSILTLTERPTLASPASGDLKLVAVAGLTFSLMFAANAALYRHIRQIHASRRSGS